MNKEIEITEEMIEAGVNALDPLLGVVSTFFAVRAVYIAMAQKAPCAAQPSSSPLCLPDGKSSP